MEEAFENSQYLEVASGKRVGIIKFAESHYKKPLLMKQATLNTLFKTNHKGNIITEIQNTIPSDENKDLAGKLSEETEISTIKSEESVQKSNNQTKRSIFTKNLGRMILLYKAG